jgi:PAS domain S-box-containing protein
MNSNYPEFVKILPEWHPVKTYFKENKKLLKLLHELSDVDITKNFQLFFNLFNQISEVDIRYTRKENQLFPYLEKYGWNGPSQGMWAFHDANRDLLRNLRKKIEAKDFNSLNEDVSIIIGELQRMILVEEMRLLPYALELLAEKDWKEMRTGEEEIGWAFNVSPISSNETTNHVEEDTVKNLPKGISGIALNEGYMNVEQINLMLQFLPVDLTYVDENDRVLFYNRGEERVFPRSAAVIGREVRFCHPPKSVGTVLKILEEFKKGTKDDAEFWINYRGKKIHIRYFAIRDQEKTYKGVIEVSQDITNIQKLEGEQRLLSWENL